MSIIFGIYRADGRDIQERELLDLGPATERHAADDTFVRGTGHVGMGFQPYHTHARSKLESLPLMDDLGNCLTLDGRVDNYAELQQLLDVPGDAVSDSFILLAAFRRWGLEFFEKIVGDWAIALWSRHDRSLYLARDHAGTRNLYYEHREGHVTWSTSIETFFVNSRSRDLDSLYTACYLACRSTGDHTPYTQIKTITPAHSFAFCQGMIVRRPHWRWMAKGQIRYGSDAEYEEHFLTLFRQSVERRTGPGAPILAHLSGGMDSTSIVCMSDHIRCEENRHSAELLDTLSYFDASEPNWDERPYFTAVESKRNKSGIHLDTQLHPRTFEPPELLGATLYWPGFDRYEINRERELLKSLPRNHFRVILSGIGGDEVLGGVPTPIPELADHLLSLHLRTLITKAIQFCLLERKPLWKMLKDTIAECKDCYWPATPFNGNDFPWINQSLNRAIILSLQEAPPRKRPMDVGPSRIINGVTWWRMLETLPHTVPSPLTHFEYRYPYLDRDLVDFLLRIPRDQLVRPGRRRALMRRALKDIVPDEILERRRKASLIRSPLAALQKEEPRIQSIFSGSVLSQCGYINETALLTSLSKINRTGNAKGWSAVTRAIAFELWVRTQESNLLNLTSSEQCFNSGTA
jgi:asparagine synthase (glutamine-hydrolysing)